MVPVRRAHVTTDKCLRNGSASWSRRAAATSWASLAWAQRGSTRAVLLRAEGQLALRAPWPRPYRNWLTSEQPDGGHTPKTKIAQRRGAGAENPRSVDRRVAFICHVALISGLTLALISLLPFQNKIKKTRGNYDNLFS